MMIGNCRAEQRKSNGGSKINLYFFYLALVLVSTALSGCFFIDDDLDDHLPLYVAEITSDIEADGDIVLTQSGTYTVSTALEMGNVLAGVDPETYDEFRGFFDFPLRGSQGIPLGADIESATLEIYINDVSVSPSERVLPFLIDLISFQPPYLIADDFDRVLQPPLLTMPIEFYPTDVGAFVVIDVTSLMDEAQIRRLADFQIRFVLDFSATTGLIEIEDDSLETAPLLTVSYY